MLWAKEPCYKSYRMTILKIEHDAIDAWWQKLNWYVIALSPTALSTQRLQALHVHLSASFLDVNRFT